TATATATSTANVAAGALAAQMTLTSATEHVALAGTTTVATFTDTNPTDTASGFTASIDWGDGTVTSGVVSGSNGSFSVAGGHTFADENPSDVVGVTITRTADSAHASATGTVAVGENDALSGTGTTINALTNQALSNVTVATFTDTDTVTAAGDLSATIDWGDGTTTAGTVTGSAGSFSVAGSHTYTAAGQDTIKVTLADDAPGTATATATSTANVSAPTGQTFTLTKNADSVHGGAGDDTVDATTGTLTAGDVIDGGGGSNTLALIGAGSFDMRAPTTLTNIATITAQEGQVAFTNGSQTFPSQVQTIFLRDGLDATVNVAPATLTPGNPKAPTINITGAHNAAVINLASGNDVVTVGDAHETVHGGTGIDQIFVNSATIGATIDGGSSGKSTLVATGGGTMAMGGNITNIATVVLNPATVAYNFTANAIDGLVVRDASSGFDTIQAGGSNQTLTGGAAGKLTMVGAAAGGDTFKDTAALLNHDTIKGFLAPGDVIDLTDVNAATASVSFVQNATSGVLTVSDGTHSAAITLFGQFAAAGFQHASDGGTGTDITYHPPQMAPIFHSPA
ncbi:MAG TPA: hypothetical protein VFA50_00515, partial [Stellaceae bacterium]|nr:hypothetical protein [Stellaceae bacterium]